MHPDTCYRSTRMEMTQREAADAIPQPYLAAIFEVKGTAGALSEITMYRAYVG